MKLKEKMHVEGLECNIRKGSFSRSQTQDCYTHGGSSQYDTLQNQLHILFLFVFTHMESKKPYAKC